MWCKHKYDNYRAIFSPPEYNLKNVKVHGADHQESMNYILHGLTTVTQVCVKCKEVRSYTVAGKVE